MATACYKSPYLQASFKGVTFKATEVTSQHGRRSAEGEFPFGENTAYADLGRKIRTYSLKARFDDNDHVLASALLIAACELTGPGVLVHPTRGVILSAACKSLTVTDDVENGQGYTEVSLDFVEANNWPNGLGLVGQLLGLVLANVIGQSRQSFRAAYQPAKVQPFRRAAVVGAAQGQIDGIAAEYAGATTSKASEAARNRVVRDLGRLATEDGLASDPDTMDQGIALGLNAVALETTGVDKFRAFRRIANNAAKQSAFIAPAKSAENAVYSHIRVLSAAYMAEGVLESTGQRTAEIFAQLDAIEAILDGEISYARSTCDNQLYLELTKFRDETAAKIYALAYDAPGIVAYNFAGRIHPVVAAYSIFNDAKRHRELETLNNLNGGRFGATVAAARVA